MGQTAEIIEFPNNRISSQAFLGKLREMIAFSTHTHEQAACYLIDDLHYLQEKNVLSPAELDTVAGKAIDVMLYFKFNFDSLASENNWYRAAIVHQMCCGMLQTLRMLRPDLNNNSELGETAYHLYRYYWPLELNRPVNTQARPITVKRW